MTTLASWTKFDYLNKQETTPPDDELVWVIEENYGDGTPEIGYFDGFTFRMWYGSDDCHVSHWAYMEHPEPPEPLIGEH